MSVDPTQSSPEIENLLAEARLVPARSRRSRRRPTRPPTCTPRPRRTSRRSGRGWRASGIELVRAVRHDARVGPAVRQVVHRRQAEHRLQLPRPPRRERPRRQGRLPLDRRAGRHPDAHLRGPAARGQPGRRTRCTELGVETGDRVAIYMPMIPELPIAMLACARIGAPHTVVFGGFSRRGAGRPHQRRRRPRCSSPPTAAGGAASPSTLKQAADEALGQTPDRSSTSSSCGASATPATAAMTDGRDSGGTTSSTASRDDCPPVAGRLRAHALPALHVGHDGQAQGHRAHDGRLPARARASPTRWSSTSSPTTSTGAPPTSAG